MTCNHNWVYSSRILTSSPAQQDRICRYCGLRDRVRQGEIWPNEYDHLLKKFHPPIDSSIDNSTQTS